MPALAVVPGHEAPAATDYPPPTWSMTCSPDARRLSPDGITLWLYRLNAGAGSVLRWDGAHGDEALYVTSGLVRVAGGEATRDVPAGGSVIIESGVRAEVVAAGDARLLHMGATDGRPPRNGPFGPPKPDGHVVHAVGPRGIYARSEPGRDTRFFADSSCPTCRITVMQTGRASQYESPAHSHSQDELIHLLSGEIQLGRWTLGPGDTLYVAADRRYTFTSGDAGFSFLNYRRDASWHSVVRGGAPVLEGGATHGFTKVADCVDVTAPGG
jgi:quercetin dioxygenase-like cupin family protein